MSDLESWSEFDSLLKIIIAMKDFIKNEVQIIFFQIDSFECDLLI